MNVEYKIKLLRDKTRLPEIQELRILAWEFSKKSHFIQDKLFVEHLNNEEEGDYIFYIEKEEQIIATVRIRIMDDLRNINAKYSTFSLPKQRPFGDYERLVVHPDFRRKGIVEQIDQFILNFATQEKIPFLITEAIPPRDSKISKLGWKKMGMIDIEGFDNAANVFQIVSLLYQTE